MNELPEINIIDIGYASAGLIDLDAEPSADSSTLLVAPQPVEFLATGDNG